MAGTICILTLLMLTLTMVSPYMQSYKQRCPLKTVSFNTGLTETIPHYEERRQALVPALENLDADIVCLQEVWYGRDVESLVHSLKKTYPYSYSALHSLNDKVDLRFRPPCGELKFLSFLACVKWKCSNSRNESEHAACASQTCGLMDLEQGCITCLVMTPSSSALNRCLFTYSNDFNIPGLLMLSKRPFENSTISGFVPGVKGLIPRSYIEADIEGLGKAVCTHLTPYLGADYFEPHLSDRYLGWTEQNFDEVRRLLSVLKSADQVTIMGDLNCGPQMDSESPACHSGSFARLEVELSSPYTDRDGQCTYCEDNPLRGDYKGDFVLDHILLRGTGVTSHSRILDENISGKNFPLSDHYGVQVIVQ